VIYDVSHRTLIRYDGIVQLAQFNLRMQPIDWPGQTVTDYSLTISPKAQVLTRPGPFLCRLTRARVEAPLSKLVIESRFRVQVDRPQPQLWADDPTIGELLNDPTLNMGLDASAPANYLYPSPRIVFDQGIADWCAEDLRVDLPIVTAGLQLTQRIHRECRFDSSATAVDTTATEAFSSRRGVCQDFAHIMITGLRAAGIPAAYASGYIRTLAAPGQARWVGADATHAWVLIWCGSQRGWLGFDPTNNCTAGPDHIVVAVGRDYSDVSPLDGMFVGGKGQRIEVQVDVAAVE
jgi:transglutaminase-like putative cysteine protease